MICSSQLYVLQHQGTDEAPDGDGVFHLEAFPIASCGLLQSRLVGSSGRHCDGQFGSIYKFFLGTHLSSTKLKRPGCVGVPIS